MARDVSPAISRHTDDLWPDLEAILDAGERAVELKLHPGWQHVQAVLLAEVDAINVRLDGAREPLTRAEYAQAHGRRSGLRAAAEALDAIVARAAKRHDEQRQRHEGAGRQEA